jgi:GcrA cell cycle regulator
LSVSETPPISPRPASAATSCGVRSPAGDPPDAHNPPALRPPRARPRRIQRTRVGLWSPGTERHARLVALWAEGVSSAEIGRRLGTTKNAVVGAAHRLGLAGRPSPIRGGGGGKWTGAKARAKALKAAGRVQEIHTGRVQPLPASAGTLPPLASTAAPTPHAPTRTRAPRPVPRNAAPVQQRPPAPVARTGGPVEPCCWPVGHPRTTGFRYCDAPGEPGRPYCHAHCLLAYQRAAA